MANYYKCGSEEQAMIKLSQDAFGALCICALRYCQGRRTYMPKLIQEIVKTHFADLSEKDLGVLEEDRKSQMAYGLYGDNCDKAEWLKFWEAFEEFRKGKATVDCRNKDYYDFCKYKDNCNPKVCFKAVDEFWEKVNEAPTDCAWK